MKPEAEPSAEPATTEPGTESKSGTGPGKAARFLPGERPQRLLALATCINMFGSGMYTTAGVIYLTRFTGLSAESVGLGLTLAGAVAMGAGIPLGMLSDRYRAKWVAVALLLVEAAAMALFAAVRSFPLFLLSATLAAVAEQGSRTLRGVLTSHAGRDDRVRLRSFIRSASNAAMSVGALAAGFVIQAGTLWAYLLLIWANAATFATAALLFALLPDYDGGDRQPSAAARPPGGRTAALRDRGYAVFAVLNGVLSVQYLIPTIAMPLWISGGSPGLRWMVAPLLVLNTVLVVLFQVRAGRTIVDAPSAGKSIRTAGALFLGACLVFAVGRSLTPVAAGVLLVLAAALHAWGEMKHAAGSFELSYALAPEHAVGQYQGVFTLSIGVAKTIGPALLTTLCIGWGAPGWWVTGLALFAAALLTQQAVQARDTTRPVMSEAR